MAIQFTAIKQVAQGVLELAYSNRITVALRASVARGNKEPLHEAFANVRDEAQAGWAFFDRHGPLYAEALVTAEQAAKLRAANFPCPYLPLELRDNLRAAWAGDNKSLEFIELSAGRYMRFAWQFGKGGRAELLAEDLWAVICVFFLRDRAAGRTAICENPGCPARYFIRKRSTQKFCEVGPCKEYGARLRSNKWWQVHGEAWRESKQKKSNKGRKQRGDL
jgi:hypothetical protein